MTGARVVYVDCSPLMRRLLDEIGVPAGMSVFDGDPGPGELSDLVADVAVVLNGHTMMDDAVLARAPRLRSIVFLGTGASSYVDLAAAERRGIRVRTILGTKGIHIMVQLPPECANNGIVTFNRQNEPLYCIPWRGMHYFGPTETVYEGNLDEIRAEDAEIESLLAEGNHLLPGLKLKRSDSLFTWAGVRPLSYDPALPMGKRSRDVHDLSDAGMPGVFAMTAGPVMTHRSAGTEMVERVQGRLKPTRKPQPVDYSACKFPDNQNSPPIVDDWTDAKIADLVHAAKHEHATDLVDLMFRRVGAGWTRTMGYRAADRAAAAVADVYGWDAVRTQREVDAYRTYLKRMHAVAAN